MEYADVRLRGKGYDGNRLRKSLKHQGAQAVIPSKINCNTPIRHDERRYRDRWRIEAAFCWLNFLLRIPTLQFS